MRLSQFAGLLLGVLVPSQTAAAQSAVSAEGDTVVLKVTSPRGHEVSFSGTIELRDAKATQRFDNVRTPFEIRIPRQNIDARFAADDGSALSGEIIPFKSGRKVGHARGTTYRGGVKLYFEPGGRFGFGERFSLRRLMF